MPASAARGTGTLWRLPYDGMVPQGRSLMVMRRWLASFLVVISGTLIGGGIGRPTTAGAQPSRATQPLPGLEKFHEWLTHVERHAPGKVDGPVLAVMTLPVEDLQAHVSELRRLLDLVTDARAGSARTNRQPALRSGNRRYTPGQVARALGVGDGDTQGDANRLLKQAAMLLTDVALRASSRPPSPGISQPPGSPSILYVDDGNYAGLENASTFWASARALLDDVAPGPARDVDVRRWYVTTVEYLHSRHDLANGQWQLDHAREILGDDARVQFQCGFVEEALAGPRFNVPLPLFIPEAVRRARPTTDDRLERAARFFRNALRLDPGLAEARLRLGRVIGLRGRHAEAVVELERVVPALSDDRLRYFAHLLLGEELAALGRRDAARASYERAATLFPFAQSPRLALSLLARRYGNRRGAREAIQDVLRIPADESRRPDPWWRYDVPVASEAEARLAELQAAWPTTRDRP